MRLSAKFLQQDRCIRRNISSRAALTILQCLFLKWIDDEHFKITTYRVLQLLFLTCHLIYATFVSICQRWLNWWFTKLSNTTLLIVWPPKSTWFFFSCSKSGLLVQHLSVIGPYKKSPTASNWNCGTACWRCCSGYISDF